MKELDKTVAAGDLDASAAHFHTIAGNVPEIEDFTFLSEFYRGLTLLRDDQSAEAVKAFENSVKLPEAYNVPRYLLQARVGAAYDNHDYRNFLEFSKQGLVYDTSATAWARVASAYSCLYVTEKSDSLLTSTQLYVDKTRLVGDTTRELAVYLNLIEYRVAMNKIVDRKDFEEKFPNGWTKN
ncbi:hypothetical protein KK062_09290 [Fulvivirgaceae bacterium PWU5]|uniref:Uncharacterized protein n=1 Tax=Dawidia cretensis TaxID=2782350 RepID=A0AAP2GV40_9BACT|nr:hypothetical protein [Dawidia cretensis]MBT1708417.1 hypothetical protein [Dawidia cretensis]